MKQTLGVIVLLLLACSSANAALLSRLLGQGYYDDVLNITWIADANLADTTTYAGSTGSEMAHLFYNTLNNKSFCDPLLSTAGTCSGPQAGWGLSNVGPFSNVQTYRTTSISPMCCTRGLCAPAISPWYRCREPCGCLVGRWPCKARCGGGR